MKLAKLMGLVLVSMFLVSSTAQAAPSLYSRLGEEPGIRYLVDTFIFKVAGDNRINHFFAKTNIPRLKTMVTNQLCQATGGPQKYTGRDMKSAHKGMGITDAHWNAFVEDFVWAMNKNGVGKWEQKQLISALAPMKPQIVQPPPKK